MITDEQIARLWHEAAAVGDVKQIALCDMAVGNYPGSAYYRGPMLRARAECERVIREAKAQDDGEG